MVKGKRMSGFYGLYERDNSRFRAVRESIEKRTGRPCSPSTAIIYLLDCYDELRQIDKAVKKSKG